MRELLSATVRRRARGLRMGSFTLVPEAGAAIKYDDNVFARTDNAEGDFYTSLEAGAALISDWSRHALEIYGGAGGNFYSEFDSEDVGYAEAGVAGRLDVARDLWLTAYARWALGYEARGTGESFVPFVEPIRTHTLEGGVLVHKHFSRLWGEAGASVRADTYSDGKLRTGGTVTRVDQSFRDGTVNEGLARGGFDVSPRTAVFVEGRYETREYEDNRFDGEGFKALAGARYELSRLVYAEAAFGYMHHDSEGAFASVDTWTYRLRLSYDVTPLMTVSAVGARDLSSPSQTDLGSNRVVSDIGMRADYAIRRNVMLSAGAGYGWVDYVDDARQDTYARASARIEYAVRPWLSLWANYDFLDYDSNVVPTIDYDKSVFAAGITSRY